MRIIQRFFFLFLTENICCDPSLEPSRRDGSNDVSQNMFLWRNMANYPWYPFLSGVMTFTSYALHVQTFTRTSPGFLLSYSLCVYFNEHQKSQVNKTIQYWVLAQGLPRMTESYIFAFIRSHRMHYMFKRLQEPRLGSCYLTHCAFTLMNIRNLKS